MTRKPKPDLREQMAAAVEAIAANYPEDVFPPDSDSRDAISGTAMRHAYRNAARFIREDFRRAEDDNQCPAINPRTDLQCLLERGHEGSHRDAEWMTIEDD